MDNDSESILKPTKKLTLQEFVDETKNLLDAMLEDYEDSTGQTEPMDWDRWLIELTSAHINS